MRFISTILCLLTGLACFSQSKTEELAIARIQYVYKLKKAIGDKIWPSFGNDKYNIPIIYYSGDTTFVANPHPKFVKQYDPIPIFVRSKLSVYRINRRIDTVQLRMMVSVSYGPDTTLYDYNTPYMKCNSREEFIQATPFKPDTRGWVAIILHEFFHGFQFLHEGYRDYVARHNFIYSAVRDPLQNLFRTQDWYRDYLKSENDLLLKACKSENRQQTDSLIRVFFDIRKERRSRIKTDSDFDFELTEKSFETMEGCARYVEAMLFSYYVKDRQLAAVDTAFNNKGNSRENIEALERITEGDYYYATGYNIVRLLKKLNIDFSSVLFKNPSVTLEELLRKSIRKNNLGTTD